MKWIPLGIPGVLTLIALATLACGQPLTTAEQTQTVQAVASAAPTATAPTPEATAAAVNTPASPPSVSTFAPATPAFITPAAAGTAGARTDCPAGTAPFADVAGLLSLCAPPDTVAVSDVDANGAPGITLGSDVGGRVAANVPRMAVAVTISRSAKFADPVTDTVCGSAFEGGKSVTISVGSLVATGCEAVSNDGSSAGPLEELHLSAPLAPNRDGSSRFLACS